MPDNILACISWHMYPSRLYMNRNSAVSSTYLRCRCSDVNTHSLLALLQCKSLGIETECSHPLCEFESFRAVEEWKVWWSKSIQRMRCPSWHHGRQLVAWVSAPYIIDGVVRFFWSYMFFLSSSHAAWGCVIIRLPNISLGLMSKHRHEEDEMVVATH